MGIMHAHALTLARKLRVATVANSDGLSNTEMGKGN